MSNFDSFDDNDNNPDFQPHEWHDEQSTKSGMSSTMKVILIITGIVGVSFLLCCGTIGYFTYRYMPKVVTNPAEINTIRDEIATLDTHPDLEPKMGMDMGVESFMNMKFVVYSSSDGTAFFSINQMQLDGPNASGNVNINEDMNKGSLILENKETEIKKISVDGTEYEFTIVRGTEKSTGDKGFKISGEIDQSAGTNNKKLSIDIGSKSKTFDEEAAIKMIESIKPK